MVILPQYEWKFMGLQTFDKIVFSEWRCYTGAIPETSAPPLTWD